MTRREQLEQAAIHINMDLQSYPRLLDRLVAVGEWADANPYIQEKECPECNKKFIDKAVFCSSECFFKDAARDDSTPEANKEEK